MKLKKLSSLDILVDRNLQGIKLEKLRQVDEAIKLYELIILEDFEGGGLDIVPNVDEADITSPGDI